MVQPDQRPSSSELVRLFLDEVTAAFEPWVVAQGGQWSSALTHVSARGQLETTTPDRIHGFFFASGEFRTPQVVGRITFGDREYFINTVISPNGRPLDHGLWEWADAAGRPDLVPRETDFVYQPERLRMIVREMAAAVRELADIVAVADTQTVERMSAARAIVQSAFDAEQRRDEHRRTVKRASEAFRKKDWPRVIELLSSVEDRLSTAEAAKLRYARAHVE